MCRLALPLRLRLLLAMLAVPRSMPLRLVMLEMCRLALPLRLRLLLAMLAVPRSMPLRLGMLAATNAHRISYCNGGSSTCPCLGSTGGWSFRQG